MKQFFSTVWNVALPRLLFWGWNTLFLCVAIFGIVPEILPNLVRDVGRFGVPWSLVGTVIGALLIPPVVMVAVLVRFPHPPRRLLSLLYGVEAPLFLLCLGRLLVLRELNPGVIFLGVGFALAALACVLDLFWPGIPIAIKLTAATVALLVGLYVAVLLAFYVVPLIGLVLKEVVSLDWVAMLKRPLPGPLIFLTGLLMLSSLVLFLAVPLALPWIYGRLWQRSFKQRPARLASAVGMMLMVALFILLNHQPQGLAFERLATPPTTNAEKQRLLEDSEWIRRGLLNAYLGSYRYLGSTGENTHVRAMYSSVFGGKPESYLWLERCYNFIAKPFLYDGEGLRNDQTRAAELYTKFFDVPIQKAERGVIVGAIAASWDRAQVAAGLLDVEEKKVRMVRQEVSLREEPGWAEIEVYEVYENQTHEQQEVFYYLALPETAAVTGLWLGDTAEREKRFEYTVAPRGAAQAVYTAEVQRRVDPALAEQVGPRQVRLRAFPVPPRPWGEDEPVPQLHMWWTVQVPAVTGEWRLPRLVERRNVFWDAETRRRWAGMPTADESWLPSSLPVSQTLSVSRELEATIAGFRVTASPLASFSPRPVAGRFAVVIDTSRSMAELTDEIETEIDRLGEREVDLYAAVAGGPARRLSGRSELEELIFYGSLRSEELLGQLEPPPLETAAAILVLTDEGGYELSDAEVEVPSLHAPTWLVHVGGRLPAAYDDKVLAALETSGGGVAGSVGEVLATLAYRRSAPVVEEVGDGYVWRFEPGVVEGTVATPTGFERVAARQLIQVLGRGGSLEALDAAHAVARQYGVVSSWSSMIVLVEERQREALEKAEAEADRFERETENGVEDLSPPSSPFAVSGVPEPETWLLLVLAGVGLVVLALRR